MSSGPTERAGAEDPPVAPEEPRPRVSAAPPDALLGPPTATGDGREEPRGRDRKDGGLQFLRELPLLLLVAFLLALLIKTFLIQAFYIPSESMEPTLLVGDRVLVNKVVYHLHEPRRGDIVVFSDPHPGDGPDRNAFQAILHWLTEGLGVSTSPEKDFIKRVVGLPGETIEGKNGTVYVDGRALKESFTHVPDGRSFGPFRVPAHSLFVMGDNRVNSNDSRYGLGFIPEDKVIGRAFVTIWPPSRFAWLRGS